MRRALILLVLLCALGWSCTQGSPPARSPEDAIRSFQATDAGAPASLAALNQAARRDPAGLRAAALKHLNDADAGRHYAAVYSLAITVEPGKGVDELSTLLASPSLDDRLLAAGALAAIGDRRGLPVLIDALDNRQALSFRDPSQPAFEFAAAELRLLTGTDLGLGTGVDAAAVAAAKPRWQAWWQANGAGLDFDARNHRYTTP